MKALMRRSPRPYDMEVVEAPLPLLQGPDWVRIKVAYAGVCGGSDIKLMKAEAGRQAKLKPPIILGHEFSGMVEEVGEKVSLVKPGDLVTVDTLISPCGHCRYCHSGDWNMCGSRKGVGSSFPGGFAEYFAGPQANLHRLPPGLPLSVGALAEPMACAVHIVHDQGRVQVGERVVVIGPGIIGLCCAMAAMAAGARVVVIGTPRGEERLATARGLGCKTLVNTEENLPALVCEAFDGQLADLAVDAIGSNQAVEMALPLLRKMGRLVIGGVPFPKTDPYQVDMGLVYRNQLSITAGRSSRPDDWPLALQILDRYCRQAEGLIGGYFSIDRWREAFDATISKQMLKAMIRF